MAEVRFEAIQAIIRAKTDTASAIDAVLERAGMGARHARETVVRSIDDVGRHARRIVSDASMQAEAAMREIAGQGPAKTLGRGFAIIRSADGAPVTSAAAVTPHARLQIQLRDGTIAAQTIEPDESTSR